MPDSELESPTTIGSPDGAPPEVAPLAAAVAALVSLVVLSSPPPHAAATSAIETIVANAVAFLSAPSLLPYSLIEAFPGFASRFGHALSRRTPPVRTASRTRARLRSRVPSRRGHVYARGCRAAAPTGPASRSRARAGGRRRWPRRSGAASDAVADPVQRLDAGALEPLAIVVELVVELVARSSRWVTEHDGCRRSHVTGSATARLAPPSTTPPSIRSTTWPGTMLDARSSQQALVHERLAGEEEVGRRACRERGDERHPLAVAPAASRPSPRP